MKSWGLLLKPGKIPHINQEPELSPFPIPIVVSVSSVFRVRQISVPVRNLSV